MVDLSIYPNLKPIFWRGRLRGQIDSVYQTREDNPAKVADFKRAIADGVIPLVGELSRAGVSKLNELEIPVPDTIIVPDDRVEEALDDALETAFGLERDLQIALRKGIEQLERGLTIADGDREQTVPSGRIDITARDQSGAMVVIELKAGPADRDAIGQILAYMGDLMEVEGQASVRGILVAREFKPRAIAAARAAPNSAWCDTQSGFRLRRFRPLRPPKPTGKTSISRRPTEVIEVDRFGLLRVNCRRRDSGSISVLMIGHLSASRALHHHHRRPSSGHAAGERGCARPRGGATEGAALGSRPAARGGRASLCSIKQWMYQAPYPRASKKFAPSSA